MPANVESMFSVRQMPWHREGTILADYPGDWAEARTLAGLDWDPITTQVYALTDLAVDGTPRYEPIEGWQCIARSDNGAVLSLNKDSYTVISHAEMGEIVESVLAQPNVKWETAGVLDGGRAVWCLALLDEPVELPGDDSLTMPYLAITNRHDGTGSRKPDAPPPAPGPRCAATPNSPSNCSASRSRRGSGSCSSPSSSPCRPRVW
jgi:phage/plasmid-like protein (TIGR03299 family)